MTRWKAKFVGIYGEICAVVDAGASSTRCCFDACHKYDIQYKAEQQIHLQLIVFGVVNHPADCEQGCKPNHAMARILNDGISNDVTVTLH